MLHPLYLIHLLELVFGRGRHSGRVFGDEGIVVLFFNLIFRRNLSERREVVLRNIRGRYQYILAAQILSLLLGL